MRFVSWLQSLFVPIRPDKKDTGATGERIAADWLKREKRFKVIARNWRAEIDRRLELDIVARDQETLVFVEVKSRPATALVPGYYSATKPKKKKAILRAARAYVRSLRQRPRTVRYDVVEVMTSKDSATPEILHFENVPLFPKEFLRGR